ncbi:DUF3841 domain-containing protein [Pseudobacteroides cellulosolvens]|uniref:DUF3841 domain-containing protein n=1 Tax=Pseudobacteroides cellulosolvens ATCC 35603 = DSM 2933 TaxID=398512 RepID=A0A0L6JI06_9FIRM|nr:DUF3841 domain-containing protein [Pseudobacteroides cellulosolvens]KNY25486.1 Protein of unknown function DUF3841 [Pseudobacteroides cellulosolvens ATCC 35603 = DSM 2933]
MGIYYSIQDLNAWTEAQHRGYLIGNEKYVWEEFLRPYHWMMSQMLKRIPEYNEEYPIWLWPEKPDLRRSGHMERGKKAILIEVELPDSKVLLSDFQAWHCVLNDYPILDYDDEIIDMELSWERIFDLEYLRKHPDWGMLDIQGVTGKIYLNQVKSVREFTCK